MYEVIISKPFVAAHRLKLYDGNYEPLHGHNWKSEIILRGEKLDKIEVLIDFLDVKAAAEKIYEQIHYTYLNENPLFVKTNCSAENVAKWIFDEMSKKLNRPEVKVYKVTVWETDDCAASYYEQ